MRHKNLVSAKASVIRKDLHKKFNISEGDIVRALDGDESCIKKLTQMGIDGQRLAKYAPILSEKIIDSINGTEALNQMWVDIYQQAAASSIAIESNIASTELANSDLVTGRIERGQKFMTDKKMRQTKHANALQVLRMEADLADIKNSANHEFRMAGLKGGLHMKQIEATKQYEEQRVDHLLQMGDRARVDLIPEKRLVGRSFVSKITNFFAGN